MLNVQKVSPIKVEDNFLRQGEFETLKEWFINSRSDIDNCPWMYSPHVIGPQGDDPNDFQFIHVFWFPNRGVVSQHIDVISPIFKDKGKNGKYKIISFYAKKARGYMASWLIKNKIRKVSDISSFSEEGYNFSHEESQNRFPVFLRG